ncbi:hypothetical protein [Desulfobulbus sp.]|uniref:hypothetical protein n=1 Tax=Desulfobulbus sp. TaxID=895 RepID=UPI0027B97D24|nr:hypothetical protein [Desulfobulbus sp.]
MQHPKDKERNAVIWGLGITIALLATFACIAKYYSNPTSLVDTYGNVAEKKAILSEMRIRLYESVEMEKNAVMALTDEQSRQFADQSRQASAGVEQQLQKLRALVDAVPLRDEKNLLVEFDRCWTEFGKLDQDILAVAVQNTNLKAAALSREQGGYAMQRFEQALGAIPPLFAGTPEEGRATSPANRALIAGLKIYALHSPHIAEANDGKMDQLEAQMQAEERLAVQSLAELAELAGSAEGTRRDAVLQAKTAFADFIQVTAEVVALSRQNSNIRSLELSLGRKRNLTAQCDETLAAFQKVVQSRTFKATR